MTTSIRRPSSRDKILEAASTLVAEHGVPQLTIEGVAVAAGVTKAGLIYHFKTRDELLAALVERMVQELDTLGEATMALRKLKATDSAAAPNSELKAALLEQVDITFDMPPARRRLMRNLLAAASTHPQLLEPVQALFDSGYAALSGAPSSGQALLISAAMDGLLLIDLLQLHQFSPSQREAMRDAVQDLIHQLP